MPATQPSPTPSLALVFERLLRDIVGQKYAPGARLPAERDLARTLGASRPTLREALRRLGEWGLIEAKRGSGIVVRDPDDWSFDVLPMYLQVGAAKDGPDGLLGFVRDLLGIRRMMFLDVIRLVAPRLAPGSLSEARGAIERAWAAREDVTQFLKEDFGMVRAIAIAAKLLPALWMLNSVSGVYLELAKPLTGAAHVPDDYLDSWRDVLDALERADGDSAAAAMARYLDNHDRRMLRILGGEA